MFQKTPNYDKLYFDQYYRLGFFPFSFFIIFLSYCITVKIMNYLEKKKGIILHEKLQELYLYFYYKRVENKKKQLKIYKDKK